MRRYEGNGAAASGFGRRWLLIDVEAQAPKYKIINIVFAAQFGQPKF
jgi:hypothetical protein